MCLTIIEVLFLIAGVALLFTGNVPQKLFGTMFGKGSYSLPSGQARLFGLWLASPLPVVLTGAVMIGALFGEDGTMYAILFEILYVIAVAIVAIVVARRIRQPVTAP